MRTKSFFMFIVVIMALMLCLSAYANHEIESAVSTSDISISTGAQAGAVSSGNSFNIGIGSITDGIANSEALSKGLTSSFNDGLTASFKGEAIAKSNADASGISIGFKPKNISGASISGIAEQTQQGTVQAGNTFATGGNHSLAQYNEIQNMSMNGCLLAISGVQVNSMAITKGITELSINPNVSASAFTANMVLSQTAQGQGEVQIGVLNQTSTSMAMIQGTANFNYTGSGAGLSFINGNVTNTGNKATATITGGSASY